MQPTVKGTVISPNYTPLPGAPSDPEDSMYKKRILCEGDSWFSLGAIPSSNMLFPLTFAESTVLYNLATPGDTIINMSSMAKNQELVKNICGQGFAVQWDLIFLSGGGNDLMDRADKLLSRPSDGAGQHMLDYVNQIEMSRLKVDIQKSYMAIAAMRNQPHSKNQETPIVTHIYDYPTPRNAPAKFRIFGIAGPWLYRAFKTHDIPDSLWISLSDYLFEWLAGVIIELANTIPNFHVISNTRETLMRSKLGETGESGDWLNEIHPSIGGYEKLAGVVSPELYQLLYP
jgi:lysophospholipase L1-like esterase